MQSSTVNMRTVAASSVVAQIGWRSGFRLGAQAQPARWTRVMRPRLAFNYPSHRVLLESIEQELGLLVVYKSVSGAIVLSLLLVRREIY